MKQTESFSCGMGGFKPNCLQCFAGIRTFVTVFSIGSLMSQVLSSYISSQITAIEKQFGLNSAQTGFLLSCNDIGFLVSTLFASYIANKVHIPRGLGITLIIYGIGGLTCSLAYFISKNMVEENTKSLFGNALEPTNIISNNLTNSTSKYPPLAFAGMSMNPLLCKPGPQNILANHRVLSNGTKNLKALFNIGVPNEYTGAAIAFIGMGK